MLLDALNFNNNPIVGLPDEYLNSCRPILSASTVINLGVMTSNENIITLDPNNFLFGYSFCCGFKSYGRII
jgi:hypothetical protein